jgi:hypothetical protein
LTLSLPDSLTNDTNNASSNPRLSNKMGGAIKKRLMLAMRIFQSGGGSSRYSVYLLYWYKCTNTDAKGRFSTIGWRRKLRRKESARESKKRPKRPSYNMYL